MPYSDPKRKIANSAVYRVREGDKLREYDRIRGKSRRADPVYSAAQIIRKRLWRKENRERHLSASRAYDNKQIRENTHRRLAKNVRHRIYKAVKSKTKGTSSVGVLGCSISELKIYLESKFVSGMSWDNYGLKGWHIDHVRPLSMFDLSDPQQVLIACHYTNLAPLWAEDNQRKYNRVAAANYTAPISPNKGMAA